MVKLEQYHSTAQTTKSETSEEFKVNLCFIINIYIRSDKIKAHSNIRLTSDKNSSYPKSNTKKTKHSTMPGKNKFLFITTIILSVLITPLSSSKKAELRGGLLFERDIDKPILINPKYALYHRDINLDDLFKATDTIQQFTQAYVQFCNKIDSDIETRTAVEIPDKSKYKILNISANIMESPEICKQNGYSLVEIRLLSDLKDIYTYLAPTKIKYVYSGIEYRYNISRLRYRSDNHPVGPIIQDLVMYKNGTDNPGTKSTIYDETALWSWKGTNKVLYDFRTQKPQIILTDVNVPPQQIVCEKIQTNKNILINTEKAQNDLLFKMVSHMCHRDQDEILTKAQVLAKEINLFRTFQESNNQNDQPFWQEHDKCEPLTCYNCHTIKTNIETEAFKLSVLLKVPLEYAIKFLEFTLLGESDFSNFIKFLQFTDWSEIVQQDSIFYKPLKIISCYISNYNFTLENILATNIQSLFHADHENFIKKMNKSVQKQHILQKRDIIDTNARFPNTYSSFGDWTARIFGGRNFRDMNHLNDGIQINSKALKAVSLNQMELRNGYDNLRHEIIILKNITQINENALLALFAEKDTKDACSKLQNIVQTALMKLAQAMSDALSHKTSPYVFSFEELQAIALKERSEKILLTGEIDDVYTTLIIKDKHYRFTFAIPVLDDKYAYRLYSARAIPIYGPDNDAVVTPPDIKYLGISADTTKYVELTRHEYVDCIKGSFCIISGIPNTFNTKDSCTAAAYRENAIKCPHIHLPNPIPFFVTYGNKTFYSVPNNYSIDTICPNLNTRNHAPAVRGISVISHIGELSINKNCFIKLPDDRIIENHHMPDTSTDLGVSNIMEALKFAPKFESHNYNWTKADIWNKWTDAPEIDIKPDWEFDMDWKNTFNKMFSPTELLAHSGRDVFILLVIIAILILICAFSTKCFRWFKTWALISNPKKYWTTIKGYNVPGFDKLPTPEEIITRARGIQWPFAFLHNVFSPRRSYRPEQRNDENERYELECRRMFHLEPSSPIIRPNNTQTQTIRPSAPTVAYSQDNSSILYPRILSAPLPEPPPIHRVPAHMNLNALRHGAQDHNRDTPSEPDSEEWEEAIQAASRRLQNLN